MISFFLWEKYFLMITTIKFVVVLSKKQTKHFIDIENINDSQKLFSAYRYATTSMIM